MGEPTKLTKTKSKPGVLIDMTGWTNERVTVIIRISKPGSRNVMWRCLCACGKTFDATGGNLRSGRQHSCGCWRSETSAAYWAAHPEKRGEAA